MVERDIIKILESDYYDWSDRMIIDYVLEDNVRLNEGDFDEEGGVYFIGDYVYEPIPKYEVEGIDISNLEPNSKEWEEAHKIVAFGRYCTCMPIPEGYKKID